MAQLGGGGNNGGSKKAQKEIGSIWIARIKGTGIFKEEVQ
jgi:hypothetical protein